MMGKDDTKEPQFFDDAITDPVQTAIGRSRPKPAKRKAGFYLSETLLQRFDRKYHELKLAGAPIDNKSGLLELALTHALNDLDQGDRSRILAKLSNPNRQH